ncbi:MAG: inosine/xanthosine triphosphatase [Bacteroidota bacterium]|nr:inosine/xanthosine triphosphatase [Bacteroidota bacterium]
MNIIIASRRLPKINGVKKAVEKISSHFGIDHSLITFTSTEVPSGVADTPKSTEESMLGAKQRARSVFVIDGKNTILSVGVEGGLFRAEGKTFLQSWVCVFDGEQFHFGCSGSIELPAHLGEAVMDRGEDLSVAIDDLTKEVNIRSRQGTFGVLTNDLLTREDSFEQAATLALMPYFNRKLYVKSE